MAVRATLNGRMNPALKPDRADECFMLDRVFLYSNRYRQHPAFDATVETSFYLNPAERGRGTGTRLYVDLLERLETQDVHSPLQVLPCPRTLPLPCTVPLAAG
jgi:hypothetical protein